MLRNKFAVITGGSDGIGLGIASAFAQNGADLCLISRNIEKLKKAKEHLSAYQVNIYTISADLSVSEDIRKTADKILSINPSVDILVNNAGIARFIPFEESEEDILDMHIDLNIKSMYLITKALYQSLIEAKGCVINISSYFADRMLSGRSSTAYSLTKGAVDSFTKSLAFEAGKKGVRVNAIAPGSIETPQLRHNLQQMDEDKQKQFETMVSSIYPLQKIGDADDIAQAAIFLASDMAKWVTGTIVHIDGGLTTN